MIPNNEKISYALGLEEIILLKWSCYPKQCRVHAIPIKLSIFFTELEKKMLTYKFKFSHSSCPTLCDSMNRRTPGLPVYPQLTEFTQTHVH